MLPARARGEGSRRRVIVVFFIVIFTLQIIVVIRVQIILLFLLNPLDFTRTVPPFFLIFIFKRRTRKEPRQAGLFARRGIWLGVV